MTVIALVQSEAKDKQRCDSRVIETSPVEHDTQGTPSCFMYDAKVPNYHLQYCCQITQQTMQEILK